MHDFSRLLEEELICALGCTEPIAVALAAAKAKAVLGKEPETIDIYASGNIIKNVKGVYVPNSGGLKGLEAAVAIGLTGGDPELELEVLSKVTQGDMDEAKKLVEEGTVNVHLKENVPTLDIEIHLGAGDDQVIVEILNRHTNIVRITKNGEELCQQAVAETGQDQDLAKGLSMDKILDYADTVDLEEVGELLDKQIKLNEAISQEGLDKEFGVGVGRLLLDENGDIRTRARAKAAAGSDARMSGCALPVVINAGSGNQGITCCLPVLEYSKAQGSSQEELYRALLVSNLTALHIKRYIGRLSAFCGVTSAGAAAAGAIAYLENPKDRQLIFDTIANSLMIVSGMICDGAKPSCAAKIASAVDAGLTGFEMAKRGKNFKTGDGLMKGNIEETIQAIGRLGREGMKETDNEVLNMMIAK